MTAGLITIFVIGLWALVCNDRTHRLHMKWLKESTAEARRRVLASRADWRAPMDLYESETPYGAHMFTLMTFGNPKRPDFENA